MSLIPFVQLHEATDEVKQLWEEVTRDFVSFLGPQASSFVPNSVKILAHRPPILKGFLAFVWATFGPGVLDERLKNLAALQTTLTNGCNY